MLTLFFGGNLSDFSLTHVDEYIDELLTKDYSCDIALPRIKKRFQPLIHKKSLTHDKNREQFFEFCVFQTPNCHINMDGTHVPKNWSLEKIGC